MEKKNIGLVVLVIILSLLVVGLGGFIVYDKVLSNNEVDNVDNDKTNNTQKESVNGDYKVVINNKSVDEGTLNTVLDIIGVPYYNNSSNACLTDAISFNNYSDNAKKIMSFYIDSHNYRYLKIPEDKIYSSQECGLGAADCYTISKEDAKKLFDMFNFDGKITDYFQESTNLKDDYIFWYGHTLGFCDKKINHDIVAEYSSEERMNEYGINIGADIKITDKQEVINNIVDDVNNSKIERTITYYFKSATNGNYYLDSVNVE